MHSIFPNVCFYSQEMFFLVPELYAKENQDFSLKDVCGDAAFSELCHVIRMREVPSM